MKSKSTSKKEIDFHEAEDQQVGIHGNKECQNCGACCIYFQILNRDGTVLKEKGEICKYLEYDPETKLTSCKIYDSDERPIDCIAFLNCDPGGLGENEKEQKETWEGLKQTAKRMPKIMEKE